VVACKAAHNVLYFRKLRLDYNRRLSEMPIASASAGLPPPLNFLIGLGRNMVAFLGREHESFILITGSEGCFFACALDKNSNHKFLAQCIFVASALLIYIRIAHSVKQAIEFCCRQREAQSGGNGKIQLPPSYIRQLDVLLTVVNCELAELRLVSILDGRMTQFKPEFSLTTELYLFR
jgi:hypothetical protein